MIICICGKSGSGKSTLAQKLKKIYGEKLIHIDVDKIAHNVLINTNVKKELVSIFGDVILENNIIDRKKLGKIVFNSEDKMNILSKVTWKYMKKEIDRIIEIYKEKIIVLDYILIHKTEYFKNSNLKILLNVSYEVRKKRCKLRDKISDGEFDLRDKASLDYNKEDFDYILEDIIDLRRVKIYE